MNGARSFRDEGSNSSYGQREPGTISTDSTGRFRQILSKREIAFVQAFALRDMRAFDYAPEPIQFDWGERFSFMFSHWPGNLARMIGWRALNALHNHKGRSLPSYRIVPEVSST